jgi:hypothetical protein
MSGIENKLASLGLDTASIVARGGHLTQDELLLAAQKVSTDVNFWGDSMSLPEFYKGPYGRFLTMFKSFGFQQGKLVKDTIAKPAGEWLASGGKRGDIGPLTRFLILTPAGGEVITDLKKWARARPRTTDIATRISENFANGAGFGMFSDALDAANYGLGGTLGYALGPIPASAGNLWTNSVAAAHGSPKPLVKQMIQEIIPGAVGKANPRLAPIVAAAAPAVSNILIPPKAKP